jgi:nicotinate-nucleotide pyrophosphorylase (carboxylating)
VLVAAALSEDVGGGDWTTEWTVAEGVRAEAVVVAKEGLVVAGVEAARMVFRTVDPRVDVDVVTGNGVGVRAGGELLRMRGPARAILTAERTALNFLSRLCGIATLTRRYVEAVEGTGTRITDTRKTTPGWRHLEKWAVRIGGGVNHRMGLHDMILVKDNHIAIAGGVGAAAARVVAGNAVGLPVEVEVTRAGQIEEVRVFGLTRILLDNMETEELREAVQRVGRWPAPRPELEASGNMTLDRVRSVAETGVEWISVGALTHSVATADLSLRVVAG